MLLTNLYVASALEALAARGVKTDVIPDASSSSSPLNPLDSPFYWQIYMQERNSKVSALAATLINSNYNRSAASEYNGTVHILIEREGPTCKVPQQHIDLLVEVLTEATKGRVAKYDEIFAGAH